MNVFATSADATTCARALDDRRVIKMIVESAQLASTACVLNGHDGRGLYRPTHQNHPCAVWCRATQANYGWLLDHLRALCEEYRRRFPGRQHRTESLLPELERSESLLPAGGLRPFANCTPFKELPVFDAYRATLREKWRNDGLAARWTNARTPDWARVEVSLFL